jgi:pantothenate kinase
MLLRLRDNQEAEIAVPVFDRAIEISRGSARMIAQSVRIIVVEGNYLLLRLPPWNSLHDLFDATVMLDVSEEELCRRLQERWEGYQLSPEQIRAKLEDNDLPNGRFVIAKSIAADYRLAN